MKYLFPFFLFLTICSCTDSYIPSEPGNDDDDSVALLLGVATNPAGHADSRSIVNNVGTAADQINKVSVYVANASDHTTYPGTPDAGTVFTAPTVAGKAWTPTAPVYVNGMLGRLYAWSPYGLAITRDASAGNHTIPVSVSATQTFDGGKAYACSATDYLYGAANATTGSEAVINVDRTQFNPAIYMQHALAQLVFTMENAADRPADNLYDYVKSVTLTSGSGTPFSAANVGCTMKLADGSLQNTSASGTLSFTQNANPARPGSTGIPVRVAYGLVLPKSATSGNNITVKVVLGTSGNDTYDRSYLVSAGTLFDIAWEKGSRYTYRLILGKRDITLGTVQIGGWSDGGTGSGTMPPVTGS